MIILLKADLDPKRWYRRLHLQLSQTLPEARLRVWPDLGNGADIDVVLVSQPAPNMWATLANVRCVMAMSAGVDALLPVIPPGIPLTRVVDHQLTANMSEYVLLHVLRQYRQQADYEAAQAQRRWHQGAPPKVETCTVGILGLGVLGTDAATKLRALGFPVLGWVRTPKTVPGVTCLHGSEGLDTLFAQSRIVVCLLPLTDETRDILDARAFSRMPRGAYVINAARGAHLVDNDLIAAIDVGHLSGATLDVFRQEPLPSSHPFWTHPKITVTPHIASITDPDSVVAQICENLCRLQAGQPLLNLVDRTAGY